MVKVEGVGRTISNTPRNPATMAAVRRSPTFSLRKITDTRTTARGTLCKMAVRLAIGMCISAVRNRKVPATSSSERARTFGVNSEGTLPSTP